MSEIIRQLPTLLGVLVGAVATYLAAAVTQRTQWRRAQQVRWDARRMDAYSAYGNAVRRYIDLAFRVAMARGFKRLVGTGPLPVDKGVPELVKAETERGAIWESILLIGSPGTISAARKWHEQAWRLDWFARGKLVGDEEWESTVDAAGKARDEFYRNARQDLGVPDPAIPEPSSRLWWRDVDQSQQ